MVDRALRGLTIALAGALAAIGFGGSILLGGVCWLAFLLCVASGWGHLVARIARTDEPDLGLRAIWGLAGYLAVAGVALAIGVCTREIVLGLMAIGFAGFAWRELTTEIPIWQHAVAGGRYLRENPIAGSAIVIGTAIVVFHLVGGVVELERNPWDDDIAYTPFVKRLLSVGNLVEPFSFRRLGAYGGQTVLQALCGVRGQLANVHMLDKSLCLAVSILAIIGYARQRTASAPLLALVIAVLVLMPDAAINTASYWSGLALFLGLYRSVVDERWGIAGLVGAAACTLRINYLAVVVLFLAITLFARLVAVARSSSWRDAWRTQRRNWRDVIVVAAIALVPYCIASMLSSRTFMFPVMQGTWTHGLSITPSVVSWVDELQYLAWDFIDTWPIVVVPPLCIVFAFARDQRLGRPFTSLLVASALGFALLAHGLVGSDPSNMWRYGFGFAATLLAVGTLELGILEDAGDLRLPPIGRWILLASLVLQIAIGRSTLPKRYLAIFNNAREAAVIDRHGDPEAILEQAHYRAMQAAVPAGANLLVMLDDPVFLDYRRNPIANLDTPGFASPIGATGQMPSFEGPEALRAYWLAQGYDYFAFVRSNSSRYFLRRDFWAERLFKDTEFFQLMSAYLLDAIVNAAEIARTQPVVYDRDGLVVVDLRGRATPVSQLRDERVRRDGWIRSYADGHDLHRVWSLATRANLRFEDGFGTPTFVDESVNNPPWFEALHRAVVSPLTGTPARWMQRRAHLRVWGDRDMRLSIDGHLNIAGLFTHPRVLVSLDGEALASTLPDAAGHFSVDARVAAAALHGDWHDLYVIFSSVGEPERDLKDLRAARVEVVEWEPAR